MLDLDTDNLLIYLSTKNKNNKIIIQRTEHNMCQNENEKK